MAYYGDERDNLRKINKEGNHPIYPSSLQKNKEIEGGNARNAGFIKRIGSDQDKKYKFNLLKMKKASKNLLNATFKNTKDASLKKFIKEVLKGKPDTTGLYTLRKEEEEEEEEEAPVKKAPVKKTAVKKAPVKKAPVKAPVKEPIESRDKAKRLFIRLLYFGSFNEWAKDDANMMDAIPLDFLTKFKNELSNIGDVIMAANPKLKTIVNDKKLKESPNNEIGTTSPGFTLDVNGNVRFTIGIRIDSGSVNCRGAGSGSGLLLNNTSTCEIYNGGVDIFNPIGTNNLMIRSWNGIGFQNHDNGVTVAIDTRGGRLFATGNISAGNVYSETVVVNRHSGNNRFYVNVGIRVPTSGVYSVNAWGQTHHWYNFAIIGINSAGNVFGDHAIKLNNIFLNIANYEVSMSIPGGDDSITQNYRITVSRL